MSVGEGKGVTRERAEDDGARNFLRVIEEMAKYRKEMPEITVMVGNEKFDSYIVKTAKRGIYEEQIGSQGARGKRCFI